MVLAGKRMRIELEEGKDGIRQLKIAGSGTEREGMPASPLRRRGSAIRAGKP